MFLWARRRYKDGKLHRREPAGPGRRCGAATVLYLGEINERERATRARTFEVFADDQAVPKQMTIFRETELTPHD